MCVIETRTYIHPNGARYTYDYPRLCPESNGPNPCRFTTREQTEQHVDGVPPLSPTAGSPVSQNFPPTPTSFANVELRRPTSSEERRSLKREQERKREKRYVIKPELIIRIGSSKKRDKEKEKQNRHSTGSVGTSASSEVIYVGSPSRRDAPAVVVPDSSSIPTVAPGYHTTIHEPTGYNTTYVHPTPPPPPPPPRRPTAGRDSSPPPSPTTLRKLRRPTQVTIHQGPAAASSSSSSEPTPTMTPGPARQRRASTSSAPADDNEFFARQAAREQARAEARRIERERQQLADEAYHAQLELDRANARERARREERDRRRDEDRRRGEEEAADRDRRRREADDARKATDREAGRERRRREEERRPESSRTQQRADAQARERALEETARQMARERAAAAQRQAEEAAEEANRRYWSPRTGMLPRPPSERRQVAGPSQSRRAADTRQPDAGALLSSQRRRETTRERGERVIAEAQADAQTRVQDHTREMVERFGDVTIEDDGERRFGGALPRRRRTIHGGSKDAEYSIDIDGGKRRRRRYFD